MGGLHSNNFSWVEKRGRKWESEKDELYRASHSQTDFNQLAQQHTYKFVYCMYHWTMRYNRQKSTQTVAQNL